MIPALIVDVALTILIILIATHYVRFYSHYCQESEPFTRHFSRIAEAFPLFWWPLNFALALYSGVTAIFAPWYWAYIGMLGCFFMGWFIPHIKVYIIAHHTDNPPIQLWAKLHWIGRLKP